MEYIVQVKFYDKQQDAITLSVDAISKWWAMFSYSMIVLSLGKKYDLSTSEIFT